NQRRAPGQAAPTPFSLGLLCRTSERANLREAQPGINAVVDSAKRILRNRNEVRQEAISIVRTRVARIKLKLANRRDVDDAHANILPGLEGNHVGNFVDVELRVVEDVELAEEFRLREHVNVTGPQNISHDRPDVGTPEDDVVRVAIHGRFRLDTVTKVLNRPLQ